MTESIWQDISWDIPLASPPEIARIGSAVHGGFPIERYTMIDLWCLHLYKWDGYIRLGDIELPVRRGYASIIPANTPMEYHFQRRSPHIFVHFRCTGTECAELYRVNAMQDLRDDFGRLFEQLTEVLDRNDSFARARVWDVLHQLVRRSVPEGAGNKSLHPSVRKTVTEIERRHTESIKVAALAACVGVSVSHLSRLFQEAFGQTVISYIRERRVSKAVHLLRQSTLPIKTVAIMVGIPDLQHFNRTIHHSLGMSPRAVRAGFQSVNAQKKSTDYIS